jgi:hypothetical protein
LPALLFIAHHVTDWDHQDVAWQFRSLTWDLEERDGRESARKAIAAAEKSHSAVATAMQRVRADYARSEERHERRRSLYRVNYTVLQKAILAEPSEVPSAVWAKTARDADLAQAAADLADLQDPHQILC